ncbi:tetratricopeptide repeat protein [Pseudomonas rhodesiae]|uniref:tetratricopeptide repeat protein n=1 Tax=Pseudomonas rhodesiae TaxID=76760 RepID=UPI002734323E|nr:tetratricopeptide repeat protein [Pseudomonas rhodesiae]WLG42025.1 tetratricopeptide repeat protein [Pseudomonas rhodesiae]
MGILSWLFNRPEAAKSNTAAKHQPAQAQSRLAQPDLQATPQIRRDKHFLRVDSLSFLGIYQLSKSKKWAIAWRDADPSVGRGGHRESGLGAYVLADVSSGTVACHGSMARPNNGQVCETGVFCLEDWHFGSTLSGTFSVFDPSGSVILAKELTANIFTSGISKHGKYAFCATGNSPTDHGNKLFLFDLVNRIEMYSVTPKAGWPDSYEVDEGTGELMALFKDMGSFRYNAHGEFMDADQLGDANLNSSHYDRIILAAEKILGEVNLTDECIQEVLIAVQRARSLGADENLAWKPTALKVQGLAHEQLGQYPEAVLVYEEALALNPKIGVKRRLASVSKRIKAE